ncbi:MAG: trigger factor [Methyloceanibacter sp.]|uniref:trigger factor n=1 Tax=Methyloceanibacter sp. TaxID=1965321 RepID=UPI003D6CF854
MNVIETNEDGLRRQLKVVIGAAELEQRLSARLDELKGKAKIKGFRPGHVPKEHLRKVYGRSVMAEVVQQAVAETSREALSQREERPAFQPKVALPEDEAEIDQIFAGTGDLAYTLSFEVLPKVEVMDLGKLALERPVAPVTDEDVGKSIERILATNQNYKPKDGAAQKGDRVTIDFVGKIDGEVFQGGSAEDAPILLGRGGFIPGFEEGLIGVKAGEARDVDATFPADYAETKLAGKTARFEVKVKEVAAPETPALDDEFAKSLGVESVDKLRETVKARMEQDRAMASRLKVKRALLDALNEAHAFDLPPTLVDNEFEAIWTQVTKDLEQSKKTFEDEGTTEEKARQEYHDIAARRVRLGLLLSEIGQRNQITVTDEEVNRALLERIRQFPGQERQVYDFYRNHPEVLAELRAPIFEDKVVDYILELAKVTERPVSGEDLYADPDDEHGHHHRHGHDHDHDHDHHRGHDHGDDHGHHHGHKHD